jgi:hypothetical protein
MLLSRQFAGPAFGWIWTPAANAAARMAAATQSVATQNGGHQRVLATY